MLRGASDFDSSPDNRTRLVPVEVFLAALDPQAGKSVSDGSAGQGGVGIAILLEVQEADE
jgi:hypothetical protein